MSRLFITAIALFLPAIALAEDIQVHPAPVSAPTTLPTTQPAQPKVLAKISPQAMQELAAVARAYGDLKSLDLAGTLSLKTVQNGQTRSHDTAFAGSYLAPNAFRHQAKGGALFGSTGKSIYGYTDRGNLYMQADAPAGKIAFDQLPDDHRTTLASEDPSLFLAIVKDPVEALRLISTEIAAAANESIDGGACNVIQAELNEPKASAKLYFDAKSHLLRRLTVDYKTAMTTAGAPQLSSAAFTVDYTSIKPDAALKTAAFAWAPPIGAHDIAKTAPAVDDSEPASALLGKPAPDFALQDMEDKTVKLSELKGSVVVLDFWATWCGPCVASMPHLEKIYTDMKPQGLKMFAVNQKEEKETVEQFVERKSLLIPVLLDSEGKVGGLYMVRGIPTTVVIGKDGAVKHVQVGFNPDGDDTLKQKIAEELKAR